MSAELFNRVAVVDVDDKRIKDLRISFKVEKDLKKHTNDLDLGIWNLSEDSRKKITKGASVKLVAGYVGTVETLFLGDVVIVTHVKQGPDWITRMQSSDGTTKLRTAHVSESFAPGTDLVEVLKRIAVSTGLALGNVVEQGVKGNIRNALGTFAKGFSVSGMAGVELDKITKTLGLEWSVQDGAIQLSEPGVPVGNEVVVLSPTSGMIGSPEMGEKNIVKVRALIQQRLIPGRRVRVQSDAMNGDFRIEKVTFNGDTHDTAWYADLEMKVAA